MGKQNLTRKRKRTFKGNRHTLPQQQQVVTEPPQQDVCMHEPPTETLRAKRVSATVTNDNEVDADDYFIFIHFKLLKEFLMEIIRCPNCGCNDVAFSNVSKSRMGFANKIAVKCNLCIWNNNFFTSPECKKKNEKAYVQIKICKIVQDCMQLKYFKDIATEFLKKS